MKRIICLTLVALMTLNTFAFANDSKGTELPETPIVKVTVDGEIVHNPLNIQSISANSNLRLKQPDTRASSFISYGNEVPNTINLRFNNTYDEKYKFFHSHLVTLPAGASSTYTWQENIEKTTSDKWSVETSVRAQGSIKFIAELEVTVSGGYEHEMTVKRGVGQSESLHINAPGKYLATWYMMAKRHYVTSDWYYYTVDSPSTRKVMADRFVGYFYEPSSSMNLIVERKN